MIEPECRMTKQALNYIKRYNQSCFCDLNDCYVKPSKNKQRAFELIKRQFEYLKGRGLKVIGSNLFVFVTGYIYDTDNGTYLRVDTASNVYEFKVKEIQDGTDM